MRMTVFFISWLSKFSRDLVSLKEDNCMNIWIRRESLVRMKRDKYLSKSLRPSTTVIFTISATETSNLKTLLFSTTNPSTWNSSILDWLSSGPIIWTNTSEPKSKILSSVHLTISLLKFSRLTTTNDAIFGPLESFFTFWWRQIHHLLESLKKRSWRKLKNINTRSIVLLRLF